LVIHFYTKPDCLLCEEALTMLQTLQNIYEFEINICDIHERDEWLEKYFLHIPVIEINDRLFTGDEIEFSKLEEQIIRKIAK